jgi:hypothetical protein
MQVGEHTHLTRLNIVLSYKTACGDAPHRVQAFNTVANCSAPCGVLQHRAEHRNTVASIATPCGASQHHAWRLRTLLSGSARWVDAAIARLLHFWPIISVHRPFADRRGKDWLMSQNFYRLPDALLATASTSFFNLINADPAVYGLSAQNAADYGVLNSAYQAAFRLAIDESTRTRVTVSSKNAARAALCDLAKVLGSSIRNTASVTNAQLLGLLPRAGRSVVGQPA